MKKNMEWKETPGSEASGENENGRELVKSITHFLVDFLSFCLRFDFK